MALALYRKYRPRTFAEVIGQEHVTEPLMQALRTGRLHHAYLFSGPRGCGKTSSARILARSLNCAAGPTPDPCGTCESCRSLANDGGGSIDVIEIDAASHGGVDDARELRERAFFAPVNSRYKIYVIDEAHMVSSAGFNALLKLVEEPPDFVKFIFATTEPEKVLGTIRSRTHHYPFRLIPPGVLRPYLEQITAAEGIAVEPAVFPLVVRAGGGSVRDSLSVLDQLIAGAGPEGVTYARAVALLGVTDVTLIDEMCDALAAGDGAAVYATVNRVAEAGHDPRRFAADLLERLRDLILLEQVPAAVEKGLIDGPADQIERMIGQSKRFGLATLSRYADIVHNGLVEMRGTTAPRLLLELICARMLLPGADDSTAALLQRLERVERQLAQGISPAPAGSPPTPQPAPTPPQASTPAPPPAMSPPVSGGPVPSADSDTPAGRPRTDRPAGEAADAPRTPPVPDRPAGGTPDVETVRQAWPEIVALVNRTNKRIAALMRDAVVRDLADDTLVLTVRSAVLAQMLSAQLELLVEATYQVLGSRWQIRCEAAGDQRSAAKAGPTGSRPASTRPGSTTPVRSERTKPAADSDWPEPARPGGAAARPVPPDEPIRGQRTGPDHRRAPSRPSAAGPGRRGGGSGVDPEWPGEPPYDPDYDAPVPAAGYEGFDPGDEPLDEAVPEPVARQTSEQQAVRLLQQKLGAEKIGEVDLI
ncbi:MAG TPA: DNA polymerase III subunit gamma and tau [Micromonosporaceae bacterium]